MYDYFNYAPYARLDNRLGNLVAEARLVQHNLILLELPATEDGKYTVKVTKRYYQFY